MMNEFQTSLLLIGIVVVVGVFAYNKWQERRATRAADDLFRSDHPDALIGEAQLDVPQPTEAGDESVLDPAVSPRPLIGADRVGTERAGPELPDARVDYIVELVSEHPVTGTMALEHWASMDRRFSRRAALNGWIEGEWRPLSQGSTCNKLRAILQLVDRRGVLGESELIEFRSDIETLASKLGVTALSPEMRQSLEAARVLDAVCAEADIQIAFHVMASHGGTFAGTKLRAAAEASGFALDGAGHFTLRDERGRELFSLRDRSGAVFAAASMKDAAPPALTLSMDVPRAPDPQRTFESMVRFGRHLASLLGGELVDDNNQPLEDRSVAAIGAQLTLVHRTLGAQGIVPGSPLALRLFS